MTLHGYWRDGDYLLAELARVEQERDELQAFFDLHRKAMERGSKLWRAERPEERELALPDAAQLLAWALDRAEAAEREVERLRGTLARIAHEYDLSNDADVLVRTLRESARAALAEPLVPPEQVRDLMQQGVELRREFERRSRPTEPLDPKLVVGAEAGEVLSYHDSGGTERTLEVPPEPEVQFCPCCGTALGLAEAGEGE